jgi:hypothetical protein
MLVAEQKADTRRDSPILCMRILYKSGMGEFAIMRSNRMGQSDSQGKMFGSNYGEKMNC